MVQNGQSSQRDISWVREAVRQRIRPTHFAVVRSWFRSAVSAQRITAEASALAVVVLLLSVFLCALGHFWHPRFAPSLAPDQSDLQGYLTTLWQAHTAIVGLSMPLLILLMEQAKSKEVLATSAGQALVSRSSMAFTVVLSLGSVIVVTITSSYLASYGTLLTNTALSCVCVGLILFAYVRALHLMLTPDELRARSEGVLRDRLRASVVESLELAATNELLFHTLKPWAPARLSEDRLRVGVWNGVLAASADGVIDDVNAGALRAILSTLAPVLPVSSIEASSLTGVTVWASDRTQVLISAVGEPVRRGQPILAVTADIPGPLLARLRRAVKVRT